jgi:hypothetical protein
MRKYGWGLVVGMIASVGCGGATTAEPAEPAEVVERTIPEREDRSVPREPIEVEVASARVGESLRLDIRGVARGHTEGEDLEDPTLWAVSAKVGDTTLDRVVNGPVRVARNPVGDPSGDQWDVIVEFSVSFSCPEEADEIDVSIVAPGRPAMTTTVVPPAK